MSGLDITLLRPLWLLALLPLAGLGWWLWSRHSALGAWSQAARPEMLRAMAALGHVETGQDRQPVLIRLVALSLIILALAGPASERREALSFRNLDGVVIVLDVSRSVTEDSRWPQILTLARFATTSLGTRPAALVVYAGDAYLATDMTLDLRQLGQTLSLISPDTVPDKGSRPERGLDLASQVLREAEVLTGDVILITDGAGLGHESLRAASDITTQGARLSVVSLQDNPLAQSHAATGNGRVFGLTEVDALADWLLHDTRTRLEQQDYPLLIWRDHGRWLLALALLPILLLFRRADA